MRPIPATVLVSAGAVVASLGLAMATVAGAVGGEAAPFVLMAGALALVAVIGARI